MAKSSDTYRDLVNYELILRKTSGVWYYRLASITKPNTNPMVSTRQKDVARAKRFADFMLEIDKEDENKDLITLGEFLAPYYTDKCPRNKGGDRYKRKMRDALDKHVLTDPIADIPLASLTRKDFKLFKQRLEANYKHQVPLQQTILKSVKTIIRYAWDMEIIPNNPSGGITIKDAPTDKPIPLSDVDIAKLFFIDPSPWESEEERMIYMLTTVSGSRRAEMLALRWDLIELLDFEDGDQSGYAKMFIHRAIKDDDLLAPEGRPKTGQFRSYYLPESAARALAKYKESRTTQGYNTKDGYLFCRKKPLRGPHRVYVHSDKGVVTKLDSRYFGVRRTYKWWNSVFLKALKKADVSTNGRKPHGLRHTYQSLFANNAETLTEEARKAAGTSKAVHKKHYFVMSTNGAINLANRIEAIIQAGIIKVTEKNKKN